MIHDTQSAQISQKRDGRNIYVIMKEIFKTTEKLKKNYFREFRWYLYSIFIVWHVFKLFSQKISIIDVRLGSTYASEDCSKNS